LLDFAQPGRQSVKLREQLQVGMLRVYVREVAIWGSGIGRDVNPFNIPLRGEADKKSLTEKVAIIRSTIRTLLQQHLSKGKRRPHADVRLHMAISQDGKIVKKVASDDLRDAVRYVMVLQLAKFGHRVRRCANAKCQRFFVRVRRQRYCSATCRNRATFKRWYQRHVLMLPGTGKTGALVMGLRTLGQSTRSKPRLHHRKRRRPIPRKVRANMSR
jgi:hypothetical protein